MEELRKQTWAKVVAMLLAIISGFMLVVTGTAAVKKACELGLIGKNDTVVSVVTGNGLKDVANAIKSAGEPINIKPDLDLMVEEFAKRGVTVE